MMAWYSHAEQCLADEKMTDALTSCPFDVEQRGRPRAVERQPIPGWLFSSHVQAVAPALRVRVRSTASLLAWEGKEFAFEEDVGT